MTTPQVKDLTKEAPRSPATLLGGYAILARTTDKCRALLHSNIGEYHYDCPLDNMLFGFKGVNGDAFKAIIQSGSSDEEVVSWLNFSGNAKTPEEIHQWTSGMIALHPYQHPDRKEWFSGECAKLGLDPEKTSLFQWLDAEDIASFAAK